MDRAATTTMATLILGETTEGPASTSADPPFIGPVYNRLLEPDPGEEVKAQGLLNVVAGERFEPLTSGL